MAAAKRRVVVQGASQMSDVPGLSGLADQAEFTFARTLPELEAALEGAEILLGWDFKAGDVALAWPHADSLEWIQWGGAGVDALLFPQLAQSQVRVTNAGGIFDGPMAEYALGLILMHAKGMRRSLELQAQKTWEYRLTTKVRGQQVVIVGVGRIGREIARTLRAVGLDITGVGRSARGGDPDFGEIHGIADLHSVLPLGDYVILITPLTEETADLFGAAELEAMKPAAYLINLGRGELLDESALIDALEDKHLSGAALDVFRTEPLPAESPFWGRPDVVVSAHISGDYHGFHTDVANLFIENFARFQAGQPLLCEVDKQLGFVPSAKG